MQTITRTVRALMAIGVLLALPAAVSQAALHTEDFSVGASWDNGVSGNANTPAAYQHLVWDSVNVNDTNGSAGGGRNGVLMMHSFGGGQAIVTTAGGFPGDITVALDVTSTGVNCGLVLGDLYVLFHPGNSTGALRVSRLSNGSLLIGNQNVGFAPAKSDSANLHHMEVAVTTATRTLDITLIDGTAGNSSSPYNKQITYAVGDYVAGTSLIGWRRGSSGQAWYDNFTVTPEPATIGLLALGVAGLAARRRRKK